MKHIYKKNYFTLLCLSLCLCAICLSGCANKANDVEEGCIMPDLPPIRLETLNTCEALSAVDVKLEAGEHTIIQTQAQFEQLVTSAKCFKEIDFSKYDLVIGKEGLSSNLAETRYQLSQSCDANQLTVTLKQGLLTIAPTVVYHLLIPKMNIAPQVTIEKEN